MGKLTPSTTSASTVTTTTNTSSTTSSSSGAQLLEITLISAQDLAPVYKSMRTYAVAWVQPDRKFNTRVDNQGNANPTWNDKFEFRVDDNFLNSEASAVMIEIYTVSWFRNHLVGTVRVLINNLIPPFLRNQPDFGTRFVALQVRRASGSPQGILNMGVSLVDSTMRGVPIYAEMGSAANAHSDMLGRKMQKEDLQKQEEEEEERVNAKIQLWRSRSEITDLTFEEEDFAPKRNGSVINGSMCNGSTVNGSELCSDVGPSASLVAEAIAKGLYPPPTSGQKALLVSRKTGEGDDGESSILEDLTVEEAKAKGYRSKAERWRTELPPTKDGDLAVVESLHSRRHSDSGLFSCFVYGFEFTIVCGAKPVKKSNDRPPIKRSSSQNNLI